MCSRIEQHLRHPATDLMIGIRATRLPDPSARGYQRGEMPARATYLICPTVVLIALAFWGSCWGFAGMLLAVPLTVVLRIVLDNLPTTRPIARLLGIG